MGLLNKAMTLTTGTKDDSDENLRRHLAGGPGRADPNRSKLVDDSDENLRRHLAGGPGRADPNRSKLVDDSDENLRKHLAGGPGRADPNRSKLVDDSDENLRKHLAGGFMRGKKNTTQANVTHYNRSYNSMTLTTAAVHETLAKTYGPKILERLKTDTSYKRPAMKAEIDRMPGKDLAEKAVSHLISKAPHSKYARWMAHTYANGGINMIEDADKAGEALGHFDKHQSKLANKDIQSYKSYKQLADAVEPHVGTKSKSEENREKTANFFKNGEATLVHDSDTHRVVIPQTEEASKHFGKNTKWCTAAEKSRNYFNDYKGTGNLYYLLDKKANQRHAIYVPHKAFENGSLQEAQGFNEEDIPVHPKEIAKLYKPAMNDVYKHVPSMVHKVTMGLVEHNGWGEKDPEYHSSADEIEKEVAKHVK